MSELFLEIVNRSIAASWIVIAVLILRFCLKKTPKWVCAGVLNKKHSVDTDKRQKSSSHMELFRVAAAFCF